MLAEQRSIITHSLVLQSTARSLRLGNIPWEKRGMPISENFLSEISINSRYNNIIILDDLIDKVTDMACGSSIIYYLFTQGRHGNNASVIHFIESMFSQNAQLLALTHQPIGKFMETYLAMFIPSPPKLKRTVLFSSSHLASN